MSFNHCFTFCKIMELFVLIFGIFKALYILYPKAKGQISVLTTFCCH